jgi:hypothetical protein
MTWVLGITPSIRRAACALLWVNTKPGYENPCILIVVGLERGNPSLWKCFFFLLCKYFIKQRRLKFNYVVMNFNNIKKIVGN